MSLASIRRIYEITVDGRPVVFYSRFIGEVGRDIAAVKYALGNVYEADLENRSEDDGTLIGSQWFTCDGDNTPLNSITLATFDKRLQKSLMSFQLQNQFLIMNYYWDRGGIVNAIQTELELPQALETMMYRFDADYGTISEATIAVLHGWRPSSDAANLSFVTATEFPIEQIPEFMHEMYVDGTIQVDGTMIREVYDYDESKANTDNVASDFDAQAASYRKWKDRVVANAEDSGASLIDVRKLRDMERYVKYRASAITGQGTESKLYTATKDVLGILEDLAPEDVSPERREALIAAAVEPNHLTQVVPFLITNFKIGFFDRTNYSFQNLPDFDGISEEEQSNLVSLALPKVLEFYNKQMPDPVDPELIKFIDLRAPSLRPGDVYRAFFHINKQMLDSLGDAEAELIATDQQVASSSTRIGDLRQELEDLVGDIESEFCTQGKTLDDEQVRIQYEKYRSFASKKKLEISREITQKLLKSRDPSNQVDGLDFDLGVFGRAHLNQEEMQSLLGDGALSLLGGIGTGVASIFEDEESRGKDGTNGSLQIKISYGDLQYNISEVSKAFLEFSKDLENYALKKKQTVQFTVQREVRFLREFTNGLQNLVRTKGDDSINLNADSMIDITFIPDPGKGSSLKTIGIDGKSVYPISGQGENAYANSLRRSRTVHYIRNIEKMYAELEDGLLAIFQGGTCDRPGPKKGTGAAYILRYTEDVSPGAKQNESTFFHAWASEFGDNVVDTLGLDDLDGENWSLKGTGSTFIPSPTFGFEKTLPSLGDNCIDNSRAVNTMLKKTFSMKRILCEYIACLGLPGVQAQIPNIPKLKWPKIPALFDGSWEDFLKNAQEIGSRLACMFLKGILDILQSPMCEERFIEGIFGAGAAQAPEVKKALASGFLDTGIPADKQSNAKDLIDALMEMLSPRELCALLNGEQANDEVYQIVRTIAESLGLGAELQTREQISNFFITIGFFVGPALCDELSRFDSKIETCGEIYSLAAQIRAAAAKGETIDPAQVQSAIDHAEKQLQNKSDAMNFLFNGGSLQDLLPDFTSLENNPAFSKPNPRTNRAAFEAAKAALGIAEMSFVSSINGYIESYYQSEARQALPGDPEYDYAANMTIQRASSNLKAFSEFDLDLEDFSSEQTTIRLRRALLILCNDYEKKQDITNPDQMVYTLNPAPDPNTNQPVPNLLQGSLIEKYTLHEIRSAEQARLYSTYREMQTIWSMMFPINCGDLDGSTRTASSLNDWVKNVFFGGNLTPGDISTLNVNYLNKINQTIERLQEQITNNIERAFTTRNENVFLSGIKEFYDPQEVQDGKADDLLTVKMGSKIETTLKHPFPGLRESMQVDILEDFGPGDVTDIARTKIKIVDDEFLNPGSREPYEVQYCEKIPSHLVPPNTDVLPRPAAYRKVITDILKSKYQAYKTGNINVNNLFLNIGFDERVATRSFTDAYEGLYEQIAAGVRTSRIFSDPEYRERLDLKLRGKYYFDPKSGCFKNPKSRPSFGVLNFEKLITNHFPDEYLKEFANPLNSPLTEDYSTPGAFEKAMMNVTLAGFVRMCLVEVLLKGALTISVWDIDFVKSNKIYRDYLVKFVNNQLDLQNFFTDNAQSRDDTIQRLAATSNIEHGRRKIILRELDGVISSLSKEIFENDAGYDFSQWFMDSIPFTQVPNTRAQDGNTWLTNVDFNYFEKLKNNNFVFLEDYMRINGSIRSFRSSREQIARAQLETLQSKMPEIRNISNTTTIPDSPVTATDISSYNIGDPSSVSLEGVYDDTDRYANTELMSTSEFSELIKSLVDNNAELSRYFHKLSGKTYSPGSRTHGLPHALSRGAMPSRIIKRTRQHVTFDKANIFSLLLKKRPDNPLGDGEKAIDKFVDHHYGTSQQDKSAFLFNVLTTGEYGDERYQTFSDSAAADLVRRAFKFGKKSDDRYYAITTNVDGAFAKEEEYREIETDEDLKGKDVGNHFKTRTGSTYFEEPEKTIVQPPSREDTLPDSSNLDLFENLNFKAGNFKSGNNDPALRERTEGKSITRRTSGNTENLFHSPKNKTTKEQYDFLLEENPNLPSEIWEETVIDLVGDSAPTFMFAGDSGWIPKDHMTDDQKKLIGEKLNTCHKWLNADDGSRYIDHATWGIFKKLYECNQDTPEVVDPKRCHFTNVFAWEDSLPTGVGAAEDLTLDVMDNKDKAFPIKPFGSAYGTKWSAYSAYDKCFGHMTRVYYKNDITFKKNPTRGNYDLTYPNEMLTPNEYKIPLRMLITQVKNQEGQVLKVFVRYVLPQFLDFENEGLNDFRAQKMTDACVDTFDGWSNFIVESFKKVMTGWYASGDGRYDTYKKYLTNPADPLNSDVFYSIGVVMALRQGGDDTAHPFPPFVVGTARGSFDENAWWGSRQGAWVSSNKVYSHACRIEADNKEGNFQQSDSFMDSLFDNPGNLLRKPGNSQISTDPIGAYSSFKSRLIGSFSGSGENEDGAITNPTPDGLNTGHAKNLDLHIKEMFMYYNLSKHSLYDHSLHQTLRTYTGILGEAQAAVPNSGTMILQTIGNLVSWFSQKRSDSFWGQTSISSNRWRTVDYGNPDVRAEWKRTLPSGQHNYERQWELEEATNNRCGPSLFYNDMRAPTTTMMYNALQHFSDADRKRFAKNLYPDNRIRLDEPAGTARRQSWTWLLKNASQINAYAYFYNCANSKHYDENMTELPTKLFLDSDDNLVDPGHDNANFYIQTNNHEQNPVRTGHYFYWNLSETDAKRMNMYMHPTEVAPQINGYISEDQAAATIKSALNDELIDYKRHVLARLREMPNLASSILSRWNAALDEIGLTKVIREVSTGYTSRLEGDETIISDILEQSEISYGLRVSMHSTENSGDSQGNYGLNTALGMLWTVNSDASEEERCGMLKTTTPEDVEINFFSIPVASHEFPLASIECFQATNLTLLEQKIKEIQPQMKRSLINSQEYKDFFEFILPYKTMATSLTIHGTTIFAGFGEMPFLLKSTKSGLASAFAASTVLDPYNDNLFGKYPSGAEVLAALGPTGLTGGEDPDCFDVPDLGEWLKMLMEMIKEFIKYFPSVVFRGISDQIDPMYKEMKRHYLACEIPDLRNGSWTAYGGRYSKTPLGLYGDEAGEKEYLPVNVNFPVDLYMGIQDYITSGWTNPARLLMSMDRLIGYIFGGPLPLLDGAAAFKIPCAKIGAEMDGWSKYKLGLSGRYGHSLTPLNAIALMTLELPRDLDLRRSICQTKEMPNPVICDDEE